MVVDASSCTHGLEGMTKLLPDDARVASLRFVDAVAFTATEILPKLEVTSRREAAQIAVRLGVTDSSR